MLSPQRYLPGTDRVFGKRALVPVIRPLTVALRVLEKTGLLEDKGEGWLLLMTTQVTKLRGLMPTTSTV